MSSTFDCNQAALGSRAARHGLDRLQSAYWPEMKDVHPLLVLSPRVFNEKTGIVIGLPMTTAGYNESNPFAVKLLGPKGKIAYILAHQPKSFDWRARGAKAHPWKQVPQDVFDRACETLNQIISTGN